MNPEFSISVPVGEWRAFLPQAFASIIAQQANVQIGLLDASAIRASGLLRMHRGPPGAGTGLTADSLQRSSKDGRTLHLAYFDAAAKSGARISFDGALGVAVFSSSEAVTQTREHGPPLRAAGRGRPPRHARHRRTGRKEALFPKLPW